MRRVDKNKVIGTPPEAVIFPQTSGAARGIKNRADTRHVRLHVTDIHLPSGSRPCLPDGFPGLFHGPGAFIHPDVMNGKSPPGQPFPQPIGKPAAARTDLQDTQFPPADLPTDNPGQRRPEHLQNHPPQRA